MTNDLIGEWTYESVEYSDGYIHTVFDPQGKAVCDCPNEDTAKRLVKLKNGKEER